MRFTPDCGDNSLSAKLFWMHRALTAYREQASGAHVSPNVREHTESRIPIVEEKIRRLMSEGADTAA